MELLGRADAVRVRKTGENLKLCKVSSAESCAVNRARSKSVVVRAGKSVLCCRQCLMKIGCGSEGCAKKPCCELGCKPCFEVNQVQYR